MNRREFLGWVGVGGLASSLPVAIAACSRQTGSSLASPVASPGSSPLASPGSAQSGSFLSAGSLADLEKNGQLLNKSLPQPVLVVRDPQNTNSLIAVNPTCPHKDCTVEWNADQAAFLCPCHDAKFALDGKVLAQPAKSPLATYPVKVEQGTILVSLNGRSPATGSTGTQPAQKPGGEEEEREHEEEREENHRNKKGEDRD